jgi:hypothetical protein
MNFLSYWFFKLYFSHSAKWQNHYILKFQYIFKTLLVKKAQVGAASHGRIQN